MPQLFCEGSEMRYQGGKSQRKVQYEYRQESRKSVWQRLSDFFHTTIGTITLVASAITAVATTLKALEAVGLIGPWWESQSVAESQTANLTEGWAIIGQNTEGRFHNMLIDMDGTAPAIGRSYAVVKTFRLMTNDPRSPLQGQRITLGLVVPGKRVEILELYMPLREPGRDQVFVHARVRAPLSSTAVGF